MGIEINRTCFEEHDYATFRERLEENLRALKQLLDRAEFGKGEASIGAELEMYIVDDDGFPLLVNDEILKDANDPQLTLELNRYNLEYNLQPYLLNEGAFQATEREILDKLKKLNGLAAGYGGRIVMVGILPTLRREDFGPGCMSDRRRYHALVSQLIKRRGGTFCIDINGADPLKMEMKDVTLEGANTSFQIHYRVNAGDFADKYNALQLVTPLVLAIAGNSPGIFGHRLWQESRIPLFKQSIDIRNLDRYKWHAPPRVNFGNGWLRKGAYELFSETVRLHEPVLPICSDEAPMEVLQQGGIPGLHELRLQQSAVWQWNRPVYDDLCGGHLRIEMRALPAGPSAVDMVANAALLVGLTEALHNDIQALIPAMPFHLAEYNFYRAAQHGLQAKLVWPSAKQNRCRDYPVTGLLKELLPIAVQGLASIGVSAEERNRYMSAIDDRLASGQTGASWQLRCVEALEKTSTREEAMHHMLERMIENSCSNKPVGQWKVENASVD